MSEELTELLNFLQMNLGGEVSLYSIDTIPPHLFRLVPSIWQNLFDLNLTTKERINRIWKPALERGNRISRILSEGCKDLLFLYSRRSEFPIRICYLYCEASSFHCLMGNPPTIQKRNQKHLENNLNIPESYELFTHIHNGLTINGNGANGLFSLNELSFVSQYLGSLINATEIEAEWNSLLIFFGNGSGDLQCYDLDRPLGEDFFTYTWDHETRKIYNPISFWDFLELFISTEMGA